MNLLPPLNLPPLPVRTRLYSGEDLLSYAHRLAARNHTTVADLEAAARDRGLLPTMSRHDPQRLDLWRQLGGLHPSAFTGPTQVNGCWVTSRPLCLACTHGDPAYGRRPGIGLVCLRHHRWLGDTQHTLPGQSPLLAAERSFRRLAVRGVLIDSPVMIFALDLAQLSVPPAWSGGPAQPLR